MKLRPPIQNRRIKPAKIYHGYKVIARQSKDSDLTISIIFGNTEMQLTMEGAENLSNALIAVIQSAKEYANNAS